MGILERAFLTLLLTVLGVSELAWAQQWVEHRPAATGFRVEFPGTPKVRTEILQTKVGLVREHSATFNLDGGTFMVIHSASPGSRLQPQTDDFYDGFHKNAPGRLIDLQRLKIQGIPTRRFVKEIPGKGILVVLMVIGASDLYQVMYGGPSGSEISTPVKRFFASFALVAK